MQRHRVMALLVGAASMSLLATACGGDSGTADDPFAEEHEEQDIVVDWDGEAVTPAIPVEDAEEGGNINVLQTADFEHLDPQNIYVSNALAFSDLFHRQLTGYIQREDGSMTLVGDLAETPGVTEDDGLTWTYTLREGITFENGDPITSADVAHGIARSFTEFGAQGPHFIQNGLDPDGTYEGPFAGDALPPGISTPDDRTIVFEFAEPFPGLPYALAFPTSTPVPVGEGDSAMDRNFISSGPYKIREYQADNTLVLERNDEWDPESDPIRHAYPDTFTFEFGVERAEQTERLRAADGDDATAVMNDQVAPELIATVEQDEEAIERAHQGPNIFSIFFSINMQRVTDHDVRKALNLAFDRDGVIKAFGGYAIADPATTIMSPVTPGWKDYDAFPEAGEEAPDGPHTGNPEAAAELIAGKDVGTLKLCIRNRDYEQQIAAVAQNGWAEAGLDVQPEFFDPANFYPVVGLKDTDCDLIYWGWGQDYPDGETVIGTILDGEQIREEGNYNLSYFDAPELNERFAELRLEADRAAVADEYGELDELIMTDYTPIIPAYYQRDFHLRGPSVGNAFFGNAWANWNLVDVYVVSE